MTRYVGTGVGEWRGSWYRYAPSIQDRTTARRIGVEVQSRQTGLSTHTGYGSHPSKPEWIARGVLGEIAALHPLAYGPDLEAWGGRKRYARSADFGPLEIRTTTRRQLYGFGTHPSRYEPGLGGWRVTAKDRGRIIICVEDRDDDLVVLGWQRADDAERLAEPLDAIIAVVYPDELYGLEELAPYADSAGRIAR